MTNLHVTISLRKDCLAVSSNGLKCTYSVISHLPCTVYYSILILNFIEKLEEEEEELYYHIFTMFTFTNSKKEQTLVKVTQNNYGANRAE